MTQPAEPANWEDPLVDDGYRLLWRTSRMLAGYGELAAAFGIDLHVPWTDNGLIRASWALRGWDRDPLGFKELAREGLRGVLPPVAALDSPTRAPHSGDVVVDRVHPVERLEQRLKGGHRVAG